MSYRLALNSQEVKEYIGDHKLLALDIETQPLKKYGNDNKASLDAHKASITGISFSIEKGTAIYAPFNHKVGKNMALGVGEGFVNSMANIQKQMQKAILTNFDTDLNVSPGFANSISNIKTASEVSNSGILGKLDSILSLLEYYIPGLQNRHICLKTGVLVGELTPPINRELARIEMSKERGR